MPTLLTVSEVAAWLQVSTAWVRQHAEGRRLPKLPGLKLGRVWRFERVVVEEWLRRLREAA